MNRIGLLVGVLALLITHDALACARCGLFGSRCKFNKSHAVVAVSPLVVKSPEVFVVNNVYAQPNGSAALLAQQGSSVYGLQGAALNYQLDSAAVLRQAADLARGAQSLAQIGLDGYNQSAGLALSLNAQVQEPLARGTAAALVLNAAGLNQPAQSQSQALRIYKDSGGRWQVEQQPDSSATITARIQSQNIGQPVNPSPSAIVDQSQVGATIAAKCSQCHGLSKTEPAANLYLDRGQQLDCRQSLKAIQAVMSGKMPKGSTLTAEERTLLVNELVALGKDQEP